MLARDPSDRPANGAEVHSQLAAVRKSLEPRRLLWAGWTLAAGALVLAGGLTLRARPLPPGRLSVAIADTMNATGEPDLDGIATLLGKALEQSRRVAIVARSRLVKLPAGALGGRRLRARAPRALLRGEAGGGRRAGSGPPPRRSHTAHRAHPAEGAAPRGGAARAPRGALLGVPGPVRPRHRGVATRSRRVLVGRRDALRGALRLHGGATVPREGGRARSASRAPDHHEPRRPRTARRGAVPGADPRGDVPCARGGRGPRVGPPRAARPRSRSRPPGARCRSADGSVSTCSGAWSRATPSTSWTTRTRTTRTRPAPARASRSGPSAARSACAARPS